jgi:hypothetical protein
MIAAAAAVLVGCFFMPNIVAAVTDAATIDSLVTTESRTINVETKLDLGIPERIALVANRNVETLPINTGRAMDAAQAESKAKAELTAFFTLGTAGQGAAGQGTADQSAAGQGAADQSAAGQGAAGPFGFAPESSEAEEGGAVFIVNTDDPSVNMVIWEFTLKDSTGNKMKITLDDETGVILKLIYASETAAGPGASTDSAMYDSALRLATLMAAYYDMPIKLADYMYIGELAYYRADLTAGGIEIPMYGVVRPSGFTMNES